MFILRKTVALLFVSLFFIHPVRAAENGAEHSSDLRDVKQENYSKPADQDCRDTLTVLLDGLIEDKKDFSLEYMHDGLRGSWNSNSFGCRNYSHALEDFAFSPEFDRYQQSSDQESDEYTLVDSAKQCKQTLISNAKHALGLINDQPVDSRLISAKGVLRLEIVSKNNGKLKIEHSECMGKVLTSWTVLAKLR